MPKNLPPTTTPLGQYPLNACLKKLAAKCGNVSIIEHHNLLDENGFLNPVLGRYKRGLPNKEDPIHLGINGLKRFVNNIKTRILHKKSSVGLTQPVAAPNPRRTQQPSQLPPFTTPWSGVRNPAITPFRPIGPPPCPVPTLPSHILPRMVHTPSRNTGGDT